MLFTIKKKKLFLIIISFFSIYLSLNLCVYSKDTLPAITNGTPWTLVFTYDWRGCGSGGKTHFERMSIASNETLRFTRDCIEVYSSVYISPVAKNGALLMPLTLTVLRDQNRLFLSYDGREISGASSATLKYDPKNTKAFQGYYWVPSY